jgi:hypothetical protein
LENLKGRDYFGDQRVDGRIILKLILKKYGVTITEFIWLRVRPSGRLF